MEGALDDLLRHPALWRAGEGVRDGGAGPPRQVPTGFAVLDEHLPGGGWPLGALTEVLHRVPGMGELSLLLPALAGLARDGRWLAWIAPPYRIAVPALEARGVDPAHVLVVRCADRDESLWAAEQALRSGACGAVLLWFRRADGRRRGTGFRELRRLQLAAEAGGTLGAVFRGTGAAREASPAALRLLLESREHGLHVELIKSRGGPRVGVWLDPGAVFPAPAMPPVPGGPS